MCGGIGVTLQCAPGGVYLSVPWVVAVCPLKRYLKRVFTIRMFTRRMFTKRVFTKRVFTIRILTERIFTKRIVTARMFRES